MIEKSKFPSRRHLLALSSAFRTMQQHIAFILNLESRGTKRALFSRARLPPRNDAVTSRSVGEALGQRFEDNWALNGQDQETRITLPHPFDACRAWKLLLSSH